MSLLNFFKKLNFRSFFTREKNKEQSFAAKPWLEQYNANVPHEINIPNITLNDILERSIQAHKGLTAFCYFGKKFSYQEFEQLISRTAAGFHQLGVKKGDRIAFILPNTPQFIISYWAALRLGAIVVPLNPLLSAHEVKTLLDIARPKVLLVLDRLFKTTQDQLDESGVEHVVLTSVGSFMPPMTRFVYFIKSGFGKKNAPPQPSRFLTFDQLCTNKPVSINESVAAFDTAALLFTGGVTGVPKAVQLTHRNLVANLLQTRAWLGDIGDAREVILAALPFFHSYGMTTCHHLAIQSGATLILEPRFNAERAIHLAIKYKVTVFPGVPTMYRAIVDVVRQRQKRLGHVRVCVSGGAPLPLDLKREFEEWGDSTLVEGYGLTEASPLTHCNPLVGQGAVGSIGLPCPNTEARIVHIDSGKPLPTNSIGELQVRGPQIMKGYWKNENETDKVLTRDGWLSTGDIAKMDDDGFFYIVDRKKDIILHGGFNIYPSEVEAVLNQHPYIRESAVVGIVDDYYGESVKAFVVLCDDATCAENEILEFCKDKLARYKIPKQIELKKTLPKNFLGKIVRRKLIN